MRRNHLRLFALALFVVIAPLALAAQKQTTKMGRIGWLCSASPGVGGFPHFLDALRARGYQDNRNIRIERRYADDKYARLPELAAELVGLKVDVIVTCDSRAALAAAKSTSTVPIVMVVHGDPVGHGYAASLARPAGNVTGLSTMLPELAGKRLELVRVLLPSVKRIAVLGTAGNSGEWEQMKLASDELGIDMVRVQISEPTEFADAFSLAEKRQAGALIVLPSPVTGPHAKTIVQLAARAKLPTVYPDRNYVTAGGLMSYGPSRQDMLRRAADYVDRILKGAKPGDLPIQQPTTFEMVINNSTAKALGLKIPHSLLVQAQVVE